jgi:spore coat polysaccharide biosynthesis protein SpsF
VSESTTIVIQARMGSTRLPGKVMRLLDGRSVLACMISRVRLARVAQRIVVATTTLSEDDVIVAEAEHCGVRVTRGPVDDVLTRYIRAFDEHGGEHGIRLTADCPLLDPAVVDRVASALVANGRALDYCSNTVTRSYPRGYDVEAFQVAALRRAASLAEDPRDREHVTRFLYTNPTLFAIGEEVRPDPLHTGEWRLTLDTDADWRVIAHIYSRLGLVGRMFDLSDVEKLLAREPEVLTWNAHIAQKQA